jgi:outer membrane protein assembly factor BamB
VLVGLVAAALIATAAVNAAERRREEERIAGLATVPGILGSLDKPLTELWTLHAQPVGGARGLLLVQTDAGALEAINKTKGTTRWSRPAEGVTTSDCQPRVDGAGSTLPSTYAGRFAPAGDAHDIVCLTSRTASPDTADHVTTTVTIVDLDTGRDAQALTVDGYLLGWTVVDGDIALATFDGQPGTAATWVRAVRWDPSANQVRWTYESAVVTPPTPAGSSGGVGVWLEVDRTSLMIVSNDKTTSVSLSTGAATDGPAPAPLSIRVAFGLAGGGQVRWEGIAGGDFPAPQGTVTAADGRVLVTFRGPPLRPMFDDGSAPDVLVAATSPLTLGGFDVGSGEQLWSLDRLAISQVSAIVGGVALIADRPHGVAVDLHTGEVLWQVDHVTGVALGLTDGRKMLVEEQASGTSALVARDLRDGTEAWRTPLPAGTQMVLSFGSAGLVAVGNGTVVGLG